MITRPTKDDPKVVPMLRSGTMHRNRELLQRCATSTISNKTNSGFDCSRETLRTLLSTFSRHATEITNEKKSSRDEIQAFRKAISSIMEAVGDGVINSDEGDAVINFIAERFISRRFDGVFSSISTPSTGAWFCIEHHSTNKWP